MKKFTLKFLNKKIETKEFDTLREAREYFHAKYPDSAGGGYGIGIESGYGMKNLYTHQKNR